MLGPSLRRRARQRRARQKGSALVEGAFVLLVSFSMLLFIVDMGRYLLMQEYIAEKTRMTARKAAVNNWNAQQVKNFLVYNTADTQTRATPGQMGLLPSHVTYATLGTPGATNHRVQVKVSGVQAFLFIPRLSGARALPAVVATVPAQSLGLTQ